MASAVSCPHFIHMLLNRTELTFPQLYIQHNITIAQTDLVKVWTYYQTPFLEIFIHFLSKLDSIFYKKSQSLSNKIQASHNSLLQIALSNMSATLSQYVTVLKNQRKREYDRLCAPAKRIQTECHYPAACSKLIPTSDAIFYCYLKQTLYYLVDTILFLDLPIFSNIKQNVEVDDSLLLPDDVPIIQQRWFTIITLHTLHENINHIQNTLESFM
ncbi:Hypothetical predicted protein [Octopus vulgaris]|uniref:Uncharacterized protein n=1 Tax=Octopus vulgaris TaxID=6645 RepID=A0AA36F557_OCTVU|nr:Hypothetical predicted protein [Octopus vulgaris]